MKKKLLFTSIMMHNVDEQGYTAVLAEFPEVVAEGNTPEEAQSNLLQAFITILEYKRDEFMNDMSQDRENITTTPFELELA